MLPEERLLELVRELAPEHVESTLKRLEEAIGRDGLTDGQLIQKCLALEDERIRSAVPISTMIAPMSRTGFGHGFCYYSSSNSRRVCHAPRNKTAYDVLCRTLKRNDPSVVCLSTEHVHFPHGRCLGEVLQQNSHVAEVYLYLPQFKLEATVDDITAESHPFEHWLEHSTTLRAVNICGSSDTTYIAFIPVLEWLLAIAAKNRSIERFESFSHHFYTPFLTTYVSTATWLKSLGLELARNATESDIRAMSQAIGTLHQLEVLKLRGTKLEYLLEHLESPATLNELSLDFASHSEPNASCCTLLSDRMRGCTQLRKLVLKNLVFNQLCWTIVSSALTVHPSMEAFHLYECTLRETMASLFPRDLQSVDAPSQHHVRELHVLGGGRSSDLPSFNIEGEVLANLLCESPLYHVTLELSRVLNENENGVSDFFRVLIAKANTSVFQARSMEFRDVDSDTLQHLSQYLPCASHLQQLTLMTDLSWTSANIKLFSSSLRRNGSLRSVELFNLLSFVGYLPTPTEILRVVDDVTTRNRVLPEMLVQSSLALHKVNSSNLGATRDNNDDTPTGPSANHFPTLIVNGAVPAPRTAPNNVLMGLLAAPEKMGHSKVDEKRPAANK